MYVSSKFAAGGVLAVALAIILWGFGVPSLQAGGAQGSCPAQTTAQTCTTCATQTCPIDTHAQHEADEDAARAQKEADHAQHEAEEAAAHARHEADEDAARAQKEADHAQHEAAEECARQQKKFDHAQHEIDEARERLAKKEAKANELAGMCVVKSEPVAETKQPEPEIERAKPTPEPEPAPIPEPVVQPAPAPVVVIEEPPPAPMPAKLPRTAGSMSLIGLIGLVSTTGGYLTRFFRR